MTTRYAYIDKTNNNTLWGPGPNPYFITLNTGDLWENTAHTVEESEVVGVYIVEQRDKRNFDLRFEQQLTPEYEIRNGKPVEIWSYEFIPAARENMLLAIDEHAEGLRIRLATQFAGQYQEYDEVYREAQEVNALPAEAVIPAGEYTFLEADVNVTFSETLNRSVENVREAATLVIETRNNWQFFGADIRSKRLAAKKNVREAATDAIAYSLYKNYVDTYN
jgi:hypothetical protein